MAKHLIDLDEDRLAAARVELGTATMKDTVNEALRRVSTDRERRWNRRTKMLMVHSSRSGVLPEYYRNHFAASSA